MKVNNSEKIVWKQKCIPFDYIAGIFVGSSICIIFLQVIITGILLNYRGFDDIIFLIIITPLSLALPFYLVCKCGKYFFILKVKGTIFFIKPKLLAFTKRFDLSEIKSIEFLLTRARYRYSPNIIGKDAKDDNILYLYLTISIKNRLGKFYVFNVIRFYRYKTTADTPFLEKSYAVKDQFINELEGLKRLFPNMISIQDEVQKEFEIY